MNIQDYLDSTYLKTSEQSGLSEEETWQKVKSLTQEAIEHSFCAVMIRPKWVKKVSEIIENHQSKVLLGTVISFPEGDMDLGDKLSEAKKALEDGADELDFVINYKAFKEGDAKHIALEVKEGNELVLSHGKCIKWIIEAAALSDNEIAEITSLIREVTQEYFAGQEKNVFVKSSTGFYLTEHGKPNGATKHNIQIMLKNAENLTVKAAGGVRNYQEAREMIEMGVKRIGTSSALIIVKGRDSEDSY